MQMNACFYFILHKINNVQLYLFLNFLVKNRDEKSISLVKRNTLLKHVYVEKSVLKSSEKYDKEQKKIKRWHKKAIF